ncbi:ROK family protein [Dactylosporangium aurantiacum]|uniref:ROK family protein n=1 Tax=Dactylosporangium aurantiacum TaxID=35754 RepID=A0A9Q9IA85_9ACTN|nr:ROK family protein [Dactylosporangium aurantiacum]MDG6103426.1 ROK family protein [Dactylosporangium aurantiacum]UWZ52066.1 ROK family protein [Dactylosporangium aurantiacum]
MSCDRVVAAIDIGGTKTAVALVRHDRMLARTQAPTPARDGGAAVLRQAAHLLDTLRDGVPAPVAFGAAVAGVVDTDGVVHSATDAIDGWDGTAVTAALTALTGLPGRTINDVHAFVLGEAGHGAAAGRRDVIGVAVGTGIGGGIISGGRLLTGARGAAGHLGHVPAGPAAGLPCPCGGSGHIEAVASGPAMTARYRAGRRATGADAERMDLRHVVAAAAHGDPLAATILREAGTALGTVLGGLVNTFDPDVVVIGGGAAVPALLAATVPAVAAAAMPIRADVPVLPTALGGDAALFGAAITALEPS